MAVAPRAVESGEHPVVSTADVRTLVERLVFERRRLRHERAARPELDANRLAIIYWQRRLAQLLSAGTEP